MGAENIFTSVNPKQGRYLAANTVSRPENRMQKVKRWRNTADPREAPKAESPLARAEDGAMGFGEEAVFR